MVLWILLFSLVVGVSLWVMKSRAAAKQVPPLGERKRPRNASEETPRSKVEETPLSIDEMRNGLQGVAYGMVRPGVSAQEKARFKQDMTEFAADDPLAKEIASRARLIVERSPGILQSGVYDQFPEYTQEQVRYALYFAHELGWIHRKKKGRSYQLFPPGDVIEG